MSIRKELVALHEELGYFEMYLAHIGQGMPEISTLLERIEYEVSKLPKDNDELIGDFDVNNPLMQNTLKELGAKLQEIVPKNLGFTVLLFEYNTVGDGLFYLSTANRDDTIATMKEFIEKNSKKVDITGNNISQNDKK